MSDFLDDLRWLAKHTDGPDSTIAKAADEIKRLRARIAELEKPRMPDDTIGTEHYITDEQIDAAVDEVGEYTDQWQQAVWHTLKQLGFVRCEGCWDCADAGGPQDGVRCNGHGWRKE